MSTQWQTFEDAPAAAEACAQHVIAVLEEALAGKEFVTFAASGGTSPRPLFAKLAISSLPWNRIHLFFVDERVVPPDDSQSNYKMVDEVLIKPARIPPGQVHRVLGELLPIAAADRYTQDIRDVFRLREGELPRFDLVHRGMGPDAHTASLFPGEPLIDDQEGIAAAVFVPKFNQWRVTLLPGVLLAARQTVFLAAGADKAEALRAVFQEDYDPKKYPAQIASRQEQGAMWFVDRAAAAALARGCGVNP